MLVHHEKITGTTVTGTFTANTQRLKFGLLREVIVKPATETTTYDVSLTNDQSLVVFQRKAQTGSIGIEVALPIHAIYTFKIDNASEDEAFTAQMIMEE